MERDEVAPVTRHLSFHTPEGVVANESHEVIVLGTYKGHVHHVTDDYYVNVTELFFKECKSILGMATYRFADFVRVERWVGLALTTYLYLEWYRWGRLDRPGLTEREREWWQSQRTAGLCRGVRADREDKELRWLGERL